MSETKTIGRNFTTPQLIRFVLPPVMTQFALSLLQTLDDGLFLSRYAGRNALAAFSIGFPIFMFIGALGELFCGISIVCSTKMGAGRSEEANRDFTTTVLAALLTGLGLSVFLKLFEDTIIRRLGATDILFPLLKSFMNIAGWYMPLMLITNLFSRFYVPAGKPQFNMITLILSSFCNFFFDWLFIARMNLGMAGAAYANLIGHLTLTVFGLLFYSSNICEIGFSKPERGNLRILPECFKFGFPQFFTSIALAINSYIANQILLNIGGEECISANTIVNNIQFMFCSGLFGLSGSVTPLVSYAYGEQNKKKIKKIIRQIILLTTGLTAIIIMIYLLGKNTMLSLYLKSDATENIRSMARYGLTVAPLAFLSFGYNVLAIDTFLALNDNKTSTMLTLLENFIFANLTIIVLPKLFGITGVWFAFATGELLTFIFTVYFIRKNWNRYTM